MALGQQRRRNYLNNQREIDRPPVVDVAASIRELRRIYKDMEDAEFAQWYAARYGIRAEAVAAVMNRQWGRE